MKLTISLMYTCAHISTDMHLHVEHTPSYTRVPTHIHIHACAVRVHWFTWVHIPVNTQHVPIRTCDTEAGQNQQHGRSACWGPGRG